VLDGKRYIVGSAGNGGGIVLEWLYHNVLSGAAGHPAHGLPSDFAALVAAAGDAADADLLCLPYVAGERAPLWDGRVRGVFFGLQLHHTGAHLLRAAIEGLIFNAYWIASGLFEALGSPRRIVATGKVLEVEWIRQLVADVFGLPVQSLGDIDASALGAAALANIATGAWTWEEAVRRHQPTEGSTVEPTGRGAYQRKLERYRRLTTALMTDLADVYLGS